ncbi:docking protein 1-like [Pseudonaja textilis]|uniref:docking protein 1-like n=1 Tax=Pseudonaja textilis TaxID=8673 RepID=UPI000EAA6E20|nr:docking protein 1-like [Pseudonaja textilis]
MTPLGEEMTHVDPMMAFEILPQCLNERWKSQWFVLYPASLHGVARLEFFDCKEGATPVDRISTKKLDKKIVRLADCVSVAPALDCSPKEGLAAFCLETNSRTYVFATEPQEAADWVAKLCEAAFLVSGTGGPGVAQGGGS